MMATSSNVGSVGLLPSASFKEKTYIGLFKQNAGVSFEGAVKIRVLAGILELEGRLITPSLSYHPLLSPLTSSRSVLTCVSSDTLVSPDLQVHLRHLKQSGEVVLVTQSKSKSGRIRLDLCDADISLINRVLSGHSWGSAQLCAVVLLKELKSTLVDTLKSHFFSSELVFPKKEECVLMNNFRILNSLTKSLTIPDTYRQIATELTTTASNPVVLVCGKKNTGKSTLCRYLINNLLNSNECVMFLECDVGQAEFTVATVISLHCITRTVSGPAYSHLTTPTKAYFLGDTSPKLLSDYYVRLVRECMAYYHGNHGHTPLIVNTCGYTTGQGLQLLNELVSIVQPSHIIRLKKATPTATPFPNDGPPPSKVPKTENDVEMGVACEGEWFPGSKCNMRVVKVDRTGPVYTRAKYTRLLAYLSYLSPLLKSLPHSNNNDAKRNFLLAATPYQVPWSTVAVHTIHRKVPCNQLLYALNGKFVALGRVSNDEIIDHSNKYHGLTKFLKSSLPIVEYLGLGLIRGIDPLKKVFYVTTPESFDVLSMTNCLVLGNTEPPMEIVSQGHMTTLCPYVLQPDSITTSSLERS